MNKKYQLISFNKEFIATDNFKLGLNNRAFRYGDGFFETMHANGLNVQFIDDHYVRIKKASQILSIELPDFFSLNFLKEQITGLLRRTKLFQAARIKLTVYRTGDGYYMPMQNNSDIIIEAVYLGKGPYELNADGITIGIYNDMFKQKSLFGSIKSINAQLYILAGIFAKNSGFNDVLLLNGDGYIVEATSSNFFAVKDKHLFTPPLLSGCVDGIMRKQVISIAQSLGYLVDADSMINPNDLLNMDELFLTNAVVGIKHISGFKDRRFFKRTANEFMKELNRRAFG